MDAFLIVYGTDLTDRFGVYRFPDALTARTKNTALIPGVPPGNHAGGAWSVIEDDVELLAKSTYPTASMIAVYNAAAPKPVAKFESRLTGAKRLLAALAAVAQPAPVTQEDKSMSDEMTKREEKAVAVAARKTERAAAKLAKQTATDEAKAAKKAARAAAQAAKASAADKPRKKYDETATIKLLVEKNPKSPKSAAYSRFALYEDGMTVGTALGTGVSRADLSWDSSHGFIEVQASA